MAAPRIASLLPSTTEIACALGLREQLVGRSHECDFPEGVERLPPLTRARFADASSREIDDRVKALVGSGLSVYDVDAQRLRALRPDVILTQDQCEVCAVSLADVEEAVREWTGAPVEVVSLSPATLGDVFDDVRRVGEACGAATRARELRTALAERIAVVGERTGALAGRPDVVCVEWIEPLMAAGNWVPELVALAGGRNALGRIGEHSPWISWEQLADEDPEVIVVAPCGFDLARTRRELGPLVERSGWEGLRAVRAARAFVADGNALFNRPGPRLVETLEALAEMLHPECFDFGQRGRAFDRIGYRESPD